MAASKASRPVQASLLLLALAAVSVAFVQNLSSAERVDEATAKLVTQMVPRFHINRPQIDDAASAALLDNYLKVLDPLHLYFLQSDYDRLAARRTSLDDELKAGNVQFGYDVYELYVQRVRQQCQLVDQIIDAPHDFTLQEAKPSDYTKIPWAKSQDELNERWRKFVKYELLIARIGDEDEAKAREDLKKRYRNLRRMVEQREQPDRLELYLTALTTVFDPHSSYMSPQSWEDFEIDLKLSLDGIGASLQSDDGATMVVQVVPGGAAEKDGRLKPGDRITGVAQVDARTGQQGEMVDVANMKLTHVVRMIRGERGTTVALRVQPKGQTELKVYQLQREKIELKAQEVKGDIIDSAERLGRPGKIGIIRLPSFYRDFAGAQGGIEGFKSAAADMVPHLNRFREAKVDAVIVDLRGNTGGALSEAIEVTGHFIDQGPVVQVRDIESAGAKVLADDLPGTLWNGPLVLICDRMSASASEIFAGAIKDYHRGIIVGDATTHGKGTVQNLMDVAPSRMFSLLGAPDRGKLKLTIQQFYRVNGDSTQNRGVRSDIMLPSLLDHYDAGESFLDHALPFNAIQAARYAVNNLAPPELIAALAQQSQARVAQSADFQKLQRIVDRFVARKNRDTVPLNEAELRRDREEGDTDDKAVNALTETLQEDEPTPADPEKPIFAKGAYNDEVLNIALDYVQMLSGRTTVKR